MIDRAEAQRLWAAYVDARTPSAPSNVVIRPRPQSAHDAWGNVWDDPGDDPLLVPFSGTPADIVRRTVP